MLECKICFKECINLNGLSQHIKKRHGSVEDYYKAYINDDNNCVVCGKPTKFKGIGKKDGWDTTCSTECKQSEEYKSIKRKLRIKNIEVKHGSIDKFYNERESVRKQNTLIKHGVEHTSMLNTSKDKTKKTNLERYGVENAMQNKQIQEKTKKTNLERYGVENAMQNKQVSSKSADTFKSKYGVGAPHEAALKLKIKQTNLERYGVENAMQNKQIQEKTKKTNLERYGAACNFKSEQFINYVKNNHRSEWWDRFNNEISSRNIKPLFNKSYYVDDNSIFKFKCLNCDSEFEINENDHGSRYLLVAERVKCKCAKYRSTAELEIFNELKKYSNPEHNKFYTKDKKRYELDIYIEEFNLGIEHNGLYWHSEIYKDKNYHYDKTKWFKDNFNIDVIHIREDEWHNKKEIILSIIKNRMNLSKKIYGRKTIKKEIDSKTYKKFLNENHIQGAMNSKIKLGLFYEDELVSVAGFGKSRFKKDEFELHRFVTKNNYQIIGGFSKLLKNFKNVTTYCDLNYFNGTGYKYIGFEKVSVNKTSYVYWNGRDILSRYQCQKHKLKSLLPVFDQSKTEYENMASNGYLKYSGCGNIKMILK